MCYFQMLPNNFEWVALLPCTKFGMLIQKIQLLLAFGQCHLVSLHFHHDVIYFKKGLPVGIAITKERS